MMDRTTQRGEQWAYKQTPRARPEPVTVLAVGKQICSPKFKVQFVDDDREGVTRWVSARSLFCPWEGLSAHLEHLALEASIETGRPSTLDELAIIVALGDLPESVASNDYNVGLIGDEGEFERLKRLTGVETASIVDGLPHYRADDGLHINLDACFRMAATVARARPSQVLR